VLVRLDALERRLLAAGIELSDRDAEPEIGLLPGKQALPQRRISVS
jgi:hypothetical protein